MKKLFLICSFLSAGFISNAQQDVSITITYNGKPACNYEVHLKHGDVVLAKGNTDNEGTVNFPGAMIITRNVDLYAQKNSGGTDKHFDVKGWIVLNEDYTYEMKMEDLLQEIAGGSGMPPSIFADSWGLTQSDCK